MDYNSNFKFARSGAFVKVPESLAENYLISTNTKCHCMGGCEVVAILSNRNQHINYVVLRIVYRITILTCSICPECMEYFALVSLCFTA